MPRSEWYKSESEKIALMSRQDDLTQNEKVRIYHHSQHQVFRKRSSILKLTTPLGLVEGHEECASALEKNVEDHLLEPANLSPQAQEILLKEVTPCFTEEDNNKLKSPQQKKEIKAVLDSCRAHAAPGTDGLTVYFYQKLWPLIGDSLTEVITSVFSGNSPSDSQKNQSNGLRE